MGDQPASSPSRIDPAPVLQEWERQFAQILHPFVETPRLAKRLANIYRLLRVRSASLESGFEAFIDRETGDYRAVLILLAINIGHPEIGVRFLRAVEASRATSWSLFIGQMRKDKLTPAFILAEDERGSLRSLLARLTDTEKALMASGHGIPFPNDMASFQLWAPEVGRYSFHWRVS